MIDCFDKACCLRSKSHKQTASGGSLVAVGVIASTRQTETMALIVVVLSRRRSKLLKGKPGMARHGSRGRGCGGLGRTPHSCPNSSSLRSSLLTPDRRVEGTKRRLEEFLRVLTIDESLNLLIPRPQNSCWPPAVHPRSPCAILTASRAAETRSNS